MPDIHPYTITLTPGHHVTVRFEGFAGEVVLAMEGPCPFVTIHGDTHFIQNGELSHFRFSKPEVNHEC